MRADASFAVPVKLWALLCVFAGVTIGGNVLLTCILTGGALLYLVLQRNFRLAASYGCFYLLLALLLTQVVAFPFAILFGRLARKFSGDQLIPLCILAYFGIAVFAMFLRTQAQFWMLAVLVGMFQGGIQALSRSYFARIIPSSQSGEYFGLLDICGKGASFMGTTVVSVVSQITGNISLGVGMIALLFLVGLILFRQASRIPS